MRTQKIGVFVSHIFGDYQKDLCQGIIDKATEYGLFVDIFCTTDGENLGDYGLGEKSILRIPTFSEYAGIIFAPGTYLLEELKEDIYKALQEKCHCPVIEIAQETSVFPKIRQDNLSPTADLVDHLIEVHHYTRIAYLGNTFEQRFSDIRFDYYKEALAKHNLPFVEEYFAEADYSDATIKAALEKLVNIPERPQAIVCYNDRMAMTVMSLLQQMGYRVPEDFALTGCDCLEMGQESTPSLTSISFPLYDVGIRAVDELLARIGGKECNATTTVRSNIVYGGSCGCPNPSVYHLRHEHKLIRRIERTEVALLRNINMAARLHRVADIDEGVDMLEEFVRKIPSLKEFHMCLYGDWNRLSHRLQTLTLSDSEDLGSDVVLLKLSMRDGNRLPECTFSKLGTLPDYIYRNSSHIYIYSPLYFENKAFGYIALAYENNQIQYPFTFFSWLMNINTMLKSIVDKRNMGLLITRLEDIYTKDDLTGLYNRQGFKLVSDRFLEEAEQQKKSLFVAVFDLDGLKTINDTYGHQEGNFAIQVLGHALESVVSENDICARLGGDEFYILGTDYTEEEANLLLNRVEKYLNNYNRLHTKSYEISASGGYFITSEFVLSDLQELFDRADRQMYNVKNFKKSRT